MTLKPKLLSDLNPGDRFYFASDKQKHVHTLVSNPTKQSCKVHPDSKRWGYEVKSNRKVVYLRSTHTEL
jgi:hypothetical protein